MCTVVYPQELALLVRAPNEDCFGVQVRDFDLP
jgi:hypothetical protein